MIKPEQVPEDVWVQVALRLESVGCLIPDNVAKLIVAEAINAWPGMRLGKYRDVAGDNDRIILPLSQET